MEYFELYLVAVDIPKSHMEHFRLMEYFFFYYTWSQ